MVVLLVFGDGMCMLFMLLLLLLLLMLLSSGRYTLVLNGNVDVAIEQ